MTCIVPLNIKQLLEKLLSGTKVSVQINTKAAGVDVPPAFRDEPILTLTLSYNFGKPCVINDWGVSATLNFSNVPYECIIPWAAFLGIVPADTKIPYVIINNVPMETEIKKAVVEKTEPVLDSTPSEPATAGVKKGPFTLIQGGKL